MNKYIDHTNLKPTSQIQDIVTLCNQAREFDFMSVCVHGGYVDLAYQLLKDTDVKVCAVIGFPLGQNTTETKVFEALDCIKKGATEIDMVINIAKVIENDEKYLVEEISAIKEAIHENVLKVIIETCLLNDEQKIFATQCIIKAKADFVKTSTGFSTSGATIDDVKLLAKVANKQIKVKAAGGVKSYDDLVAMIEAGADRIGTSSGVQLLSNQKTNEGY